MRIGVPKEVHAGERRVATVPEVAEKLIKLGFSVTVESGAGEGANYSDEAYRGVGCEIADRAGVWSGSDIILKVRGPEIDPEQSIDEIASLREGGNLISFIWPAQNPDLMEKLAAKEATVRIARLKGRESSPKALRQHDPVE